jgi:hypothetical protein
MVVLQNVGSNQYDSMGITIRSGFDLGIAKSWTTSHEAHNIGDWVNRVK